MTAVTDLSGVIPDGFPGQRMLVVPRPRVREALAHPGTSHLVVTDCGYFPQAHSHGRVRQSPIPQAVVILCVKGKGWCVTAAGRFAVTAGQVIILPPHQAHSYGADSDDPWTLWWLHLDGSDLEGFLSFAGMTISAPVRTLSDMYATVSLVAEVIQWMERDTTDSSLLAAAGAAWHLMALLASDRASAGGTSNSIERAIDYLRGHVTQRISVTDLAAMAGLSNSHFAALFKGHTGLAVLNYQTQLRMASARELLDTTTQPVEMIAHSVGYEDSFYFARQFKKIHGLTPSVYRKHDRG
ncbi:AraC family transcriptional regulator [Cryobacterium algoritolerans]|uniref:AraC family transcriptional regulator n=1 Tax=Cryobacterium algoritolerans TaxID=1259184 RepID=A0A4R8WRZ6_9MICO|nr:AraC family transcriptional regulator [Cryobacterium algoritolerans]TFC13253.1 AraC family transcriptional regulator [Cryobacterium algoritolerans]